MCIYVCVCVCLCSSDGKMSACNVGDLGSVPELEQSTDEGNGTLIQYTCLENPMDRRAWRATVLGVGRGEHDLVTKPPSIFIPRASLVGLTQ